MSCDQIQTEKKLILLETQEMKKYWWYGSVYHGVNLVVSMAWWAMDVVQ